MMQRNTQQGSALLYVILIIGFVFVISFGLSTISLREIKTVSVTGSSEAAYYSAESEIERALYATFRGDPTAVERQGDCFASSPQGQNFSRLQCVTTQQDEQGSGTELDVQLRQLEYQTVTLFDVSDLSTTPITPGTKLTITQTVGTSWAEVIVMHFNPNDLGTFDLGSLLNETNFQGASSIPGTRFLCQPQALEPATATCEVDFAAIGNINTDRFLVQVRPVHGPASEVVNWHLSTNTNVSLPQGQLTIRAFGTDEQLGIRRAIAVVLDTAQRPIQLFDYALFSDEPIEKDASQPREPAP